MSATSSTSTSPAIFSGNSRYASDFQGVIDRATAFASLPLRQLQNDAATLNDQAAAFTAIDEKFAAVKSSLEQIQEALGGSSFDTTVADPDVVAVAIGEGAMEGSYTIEASDAGAFASSMTASAWQAKASFSSMRSMSASVRPACRRAFGIASTGPMPISSGGTPATA